MFHGRFAEPFFDFPFALMGASTFAHARIAAVYASFPQRPLRRFQRFRDSFDA